MLSVLLLFFTVFEKKINSLLSSSSLHFFAQAVFKSFFLTYTFSSSSSFFLVRFARSNFL